MLYNKNKNTYAYSLNIFLNTRNKFHVSSHLCIILNWKNKLRLNIYQNYKRLGQSKCEGTTVCNNLHHVPSLPDLNPPRKSTIIKTFRKYPYYALTLLRPVHMIRFWVSPRQKKNYWNNLKMVWCANYVIAAMLDDFDKGFFLIAIQISSNMAKFSLFIKSLGKGCTSPIVRISMT